MPGKCVFVVKEDGGTGRIPVGRKAGSGAICLFCAFLAATIRQKWDMPEGGNGESNPKEAGKGAEARW